MNKPFLQLLGAIMALALLLAPAAAFAEDEQQPVSVNIRTGANDYVFVPGAELDINDLYLNSIPYQTLQSPRGDIAVRTSDLTAAAVATQFVNDFNARHPEDPFDTDANLRLKSGYGVKSTRKSLPDMKKIRAAFKKANFTSSQRSAYFPNLMQALGAFTKMLEREQEKDQSLLDRMAVFFRGKKQKQFAEEMQDLYALLFDIRAAIASGDIPARVLDEKPTEDLLVIFREMLSECGMDLESISFWDNDVAWTAWAAENGKAEGGGFSLKGQQFRLSDGKGNDVLITVASVRRPADPVESPPTELEVVSDNIIPDTDVLPFSVGEDYVPEGIDGTVSAPRICIIDGPSDATYEWDCSPLPEGLDFEPDSSDSSGAYIVGTPTVIDEEGTDVTVSASTTVDGLFYEGSLEFVIIVTESSAGVEPGL